MRQAVRFAPWPDFEDDERAAVENVLRSGRVNYWTGEEGRTFERAYAAALGRRHAVALHNGTVALELALWALGIGPGDEVIVPSRTFVATASAVAMRRGDARLRRRRAFERHACRPRPSRRLVRSGRGP